MFLCINILKASGLREDPGNPPNRGVLKKVCENGKNTKMILLRLISV
jgi:hypothetical protein